MLKLLFFLILSFVIVFLLAGWLTRIIFTKVDLTDYHDKNSQAVNKLR